VPIHSLVKEITQGELKVLKSALTDRHPLPLPADSSDAAVAELHEMLLEMRNFASSMLEGDLSQSIRHKGYTAGVMKALQAHLRSLSFQARAALQGDPAQPFESMGDFAESVHSMSQQLTDMKKQLEEANQTLQLRMDTDALTGLYNFSFLMKTLENEIERSRRYDAPLSIVVLDINHFKKINDTYGYRIGDDVLEKTALLLRQILRPSDTAGRYGSGEFMLILPNTDLVGASVLAERVRSLIAAAPFTESGLNVTVSTGIAQWENHKLVDLIQEANDNLHSAKHKGKKTKENM
jgi:diguanylate cyclase (GGDEF)-like protein